jgi:hypothetical protein
MVRRGTLRFLVTFGVLLALVLPTVAALADGTETLGDPSIPIASGSGHVAAGTGLIEQPGTIDITVPEGEIRQVLLYWEGHGDCGIMPQPCQLGNSINVNGTAVPDSAIQRIGGPTFFYNLGSGNMHSLSYRADITDLGLVAVGINSLLVSGVSFDASSPTWGNVPGFANGASVVVIYDDGSRAEIGIRDGNDNAFDNDDSAKGPTGFNSPLDTTVPQEFNFAPEANDRVADLTVLVGSVESPEWPEGPRPNRIVVKINGVETYYDNLLTSGDGPTWDTLTLQVPIPANASSLTVQLLSFDDGTTNLPASLSWVAAALSVPITPVNGVGAGTPGYWMNHPEAWPVEEITIGGVTYSKADAIANMFAPSRGDQTYNMFMHLVAAKLNVLSGTDSSCIADTIAAADQWMTDYPLGSNVRGNNGAWNVGEPLKNTLDAYNNGLLCAPSRDSLE